jgi:hypothetical protein
LLSAIGNGGNRGASSAAKIKNNTVTHERAKQEKKKIEWLTSE